MQEKKRKGGKKKKDLRSAERKSRDSFCIDDVLIGLDWIGLELVAWLDLHSGILKPAVLRRGRRSRRGGMEKGRGGEGRATLSVGLVLYMFDTPTAVNELTN